MPNSSSHHPANHDYAGYLDRSQWPLQGLYFLLPLLALYEWGTFKLAPAGDQRLPPIVAETLLDKGFQWFGVSGVHLPAILVVVVLFCMHLVRRDPWRPEFKLYAVMWLETIGWVLPLFLFATVLVRGLSSPIESLQIVAEQTDQWKAHLIFSVGAGIYEELLFRLICIALLHMLFVDVLALPEKYGGAAAIGISAVAFAVYHFTDANPFSWGKLAFYSMAGVYFALIYLMRGFGVVVGTHALYDVMITWLNFDLAGRFMDWAGFN